MTIGRREASLVTLAMSGSAIVGMYTVMCARVVRERVDGTYRRE